MDTPEATNSPIEARTTNDSVIDYTKLSATDDGHVELGVESDWGVTEPQTSKPAETEEQWLQSGRFHTETPAADPVLTTPSVGDYVRIKGRGKARFGEVSSIVGGRAWVVLPSGGKSLVRVGQLEAAIRPDPEAATPATPKPAKPAKAAKSKKGGASAKKPAAPAAVEPEQAPEVEQTPAIEAPTLISYNDEFRDRVFSHLNAIKVQLEDGVSALPLALEISSTDEPFECAPIELLESIVGEWIEANYPSDFPQDEAPAERDEMPPAEAPPAALVVATTAALPSARQRNIDLDAAAARGVMPEKPTITSKANRHCQARLDKLANFAAADNWEGVAGMMITGVNTYAIEARRYQARLLAAHKAQTAQ